MPGFSLGWISLLVSYPFRSWESIRFKLPYCGVNRYIRSSHSPALERIGGYAAIG